ncbi:MAG: DUF4224 domain-containing protein [Pseudomonadota bacterium]
MRDKPLFLEENEITALTGKKRRKSQLHVLAQMGITYLIRPDHSLVVARKHVEQIMGIESTHQKQLPTIEPNWDALNA